MSTQWFVNVGELETGALRFRNGALYYSISEDWWPLSKCFNCKSPHKGGFLGFMLDYVPAEGIVRLAGAGPFCVSCERRSRAVTRALNRFDLISRSLEDWASITSLTGEFLFHEVYRLVGPGAPVLPFHSMFRVLFDFEYNRYPVYGGDTTPPPKEEDLRKPIPVPISPPATVSPKGSLSGDGILIVEDGYEILLLLCFDLILSFFIDERSMWKSLRAKKNQCGPMMSIPVSLVLVIIVVMMSPKYCGWVCVKIVSSVR